MEKPIRVPVMLCAGCEAVYDHTRDEVPCCETYRPSRSETGVAHLVPDSLEARLIELGERAERLHAVGASLADADPARIEDRYDIALAMYQEAVLAVRAHPDFRPDQKEGA